MVYPRRVGLCGPSVASTLAQLVSNPFAVILGTVAPALMIDVGWLALVVWGPRLSARRQFHNTPSMQAPFTVEASDSGIHFQSVHGDHRLAWSTYVGWTEEDSVFVILPQGQIGFPVPKRAFTEEQLAQFREILHRKVGRK